MKEFVTELTAVYDGHTVTAKDDLGRIVYRGRPYPQLIRESIISYYEAYAIKNEWGSPCVACNFDLLFWDNLIKEGQSYKLTVRIEYEESTGDEDKTQKQNGEEVIEIISRDKNTVRLVKCDTYWKVTLNGRTVYVDSNQAGVKYFFDRLTEALR